MLEALNDALPTELCETGLACEKVLKLLHNYEDHFHFYMYSVLVSAVAMVAELLRYMIESYVMVGYWFWEAKTKSVVFLVCFGTSDSMSNSMLNDKNMEFLVRL